MRQDPLRLLAGFTTTQHGYFTTPQAVEVKISPDTLKRLRRRGLIQREHPRVWRATCVPPTWEGRLMAAVLAAGEGAVATRSWAARLHGTERIELTEQPEVVRPGRRKPLLQGVTVHRTVELDRCDTTLLRGIPTTSGARTVIDLASRLETPDVMALADDMICRRRTSRDWLYRRACELQRGRGGVNTLVAITHPDAEGEFWSWLERSFSRDVVAQFDLPRPAYNVALHDDEGFIGHADACWERRLTVVTELEGLRFHNLPSARRKDAQRANRYALSGRIPLRFTYEDVTKEPGRVAAEIRRALVAAA